MAKKKKPKMSVGRAWGIATAWVIFLGFFYIIFWRQLSYGWLFLFYLLYLAVVLVAFRKTVYGELGYLLHGFGKKELGLSICQKACQNGTRSIRALTLYGLTLLREGRTEEAATYFMQGLTLNNRRNLLYDKYLVANLASCYWLNGEIDRAIDSLRDLEYRYGYLNPDVSTTLGYLYLLKGDMEKALSYSNAALENDAQHGPALDNLGQIAFLQKDYEKAEAYFLQALSVKPTMADSKYYLGVIYQQRNDLTLAARYFEEAHNATVTALNTVTRQQIDEKYNEFFKEGSVL